MKHLFGTIVVALFCATPTGANTVSISPSLEALVSQFDAVVFGQENGPSLQVVSRWPESPKVAYFVSPEFVGEPPITRIASFLESIASITHLPVLAADTPNQATLKMGFFRRADFAALNAAEGTDQAQYDRFVRGSACLGIAASNPGHPGSITGGAVMIGTDISESLQEHCIFEELVQVMGLPSDACHYRPSLFCEADHVTGLTDADALLLKVLYDPRIATGMTRDQAMPIAKQILTEYAQGAAQ